MDATKFPTILLDGEEDGEYLVPVPFDLDIVRGVDYTVHPRQRAIELFLQIKGQKELEYVPILYGEGVERETLQNVQSIRLVSAQSVLSD